MYNENVNEGGLLTQYPDLSSNPESPVLLREATFLLKNVFRSAKRRVRNSGTQSVRQRRVYILYHMAHGPDGHIERAALASLLNCSVATVDKDIACIRGHLRMECESRALPAKAFEALIDEIG